MERMSATTSSGATSSVASASDGVILTPSDSASRSSTPLVDNRVQDLAEQVGTIRFSQDVPLPSIEGSSTDSSGGVAISRGAGTAHSRTPSLSLTPPATTGPADLRDGPADSIDGRLGMSEVTAALEGVVNNSDVSGALLRPQSPAVRNSSSPRRVSRRRSPSQTNVSPHNVLDEDLPSDPFHDPNFQQALSDAKRFMLDLSDVLSSSSIRNDPDSSMRRLHETAGTLAHFNCPSTRTVAFVGDSGVGKSSLLNSLLDFRDLARTSNSGAACTCVVTEYHYHTTNNFATEVEWFSMDEIAVQLTELLQAYRHYHLRGADIDSEELSDLKDHADVAQDTFRAMFRGYLEDDLFLTQWPEETVLETLQSWARDISPWSSGRREVFNSLEDCTTLLQLLTSEQDSTNEPAKWPYISKVKVFSKAHILSNGLVLADLPGLRDLNLARRNITERYLCQCDEIFAVCLIGRAKTDASVMSVFELARQAKLSHVGIICTKSDEIKAEEAKRDWRRERAGIIQKLLDAIARDKRDLDTIEADLEGYEDDDELYEDDLEEVLALGRRSKQTKKRHDEHEFELKKYLIDTRNTDIIQSLTNQYRNKVPGNDLKVFCVSNSDYWDLRDKPKDVAFPFLLLSGIFTVRKHCISMVSSSQRRITTKYIMDDIPALLGDIELWVQSGTENADAERKEQIRQTLNTVEARLNRELTGRTSRINTIARSFIEEFMEQIFRRRQINDWTRAASNASGVWSEWHFASYSAFCQRYGIHSTKAAGWHNWNEEAIEQMASDLSAPWQDLRSTLQISLERESKFIEDLIEWAIEFIENELHGSSDPATTLCRSLESHQRLLLTGFEQACEKFEADLSMLRTDALSGIRTSFIGTLMEESYKKCNRDGGSGSHSRRKKVINDRLADERVFESLQISFRNQFRILAENLQTDIQAAVATHLLGITNTLNIVRNENVALESERDPEFRGRVERKVREVVREVDRLKGVLNSLRNN